MLKPKDCTTCKHLIIATSYCNHCTNESKHQPKVKPKGGTKE